MASQSDPSGQRQMPTHGRSPVRPVARRSGMRWLVWAALAEFGVGFIAIAIFAAQDRSSSWCWGPSLGCEEPWYMEAWLTWVAVACVVVALLVIPALVGVRLKCSGWTARATVAVVLAAELAVVAGLLAGPAFVRWRYPEHYSVSDLDPVRWLWWFWLAVAAVSVVFVAWVANFVACTAGKPPHQPRLYRSFTDWEA